MSKAEILAELPNLSAGERDDVRRRLAELDEDALLQVASELAATECYELEQWDADEVEDMVLALAELAQLAESQGQAVFVWMHPLLT